MADEQMKALIYRTKLAEQAERYDDMVDFMRAVAKATNVVLSVEERNLLSVAYKNVIGARRASWRVLDSIESKEHQRLEDDADENGGSWKHSLVQTYKGEVEKEIDAICTEILDIIDKHLLQAKGLSSEATVFYYKMSGDYYRYLAEFKVGQAKDEAAKKAKEAYETAQEFAERPHPEGLQPTNPIRLGLALNFSVFYYEILTEHRDACDLAKKAFDDAIAELDQLQEDSYKDATLIMQLLRDNLTLWTSNTDDEEGKD